LFALKRRTGSVRQDISLNFGGFDNEKSTQTANMHSEDEDTLLMQLEGGLVGMKQPAVPRTASFLSRVRKVDRTESNESMDSDQFLWSDDGDALAPTAVSK
jgi:hypothetical protein